MAELWIIGSSLFILAATCYLLFLTSDPLEEIGGRLGKLLHVPEDVIAATFQALATSGPEIVMAILAATAFVGGGWLTLQMGEKACSGCLNMCFSAMDNLLGIGCLGIIFMIARGTVTKKEVIEVAPSVKAGLIFYILAATCLCIFVTFDKESYLFGSGESISRAEAPDVKVPFVLVEVESKGYDAAKVRSDVAPALNTAMKAVPGVSGVTMKCGDEMCRIMVKFPDTTSLADADKSVRHSVEIARRTLPLVDGKLLIPSVSMIDAERDVSIITPVQGWVLMIIGIMFIVSQFFIPPWLRRIERIKAAENGQDPDEDDDEDEDDQGAPLPSSVGGWIKDFLGHGFLYAFLVFGLIVFVRECLGATFSMAAVGIVSVGGILLAFTSYVSSFPEFMMTYRFAISNKKNALLAMLFGSNVIDLAFAGFRAIWRGEKMSVYTTGWFPQLLPLYLWALPVLAVVALIALWTKKIRYGHAFPLVVFYLLYIISGLILL